MMKSSITVNELLSLSVQLVKESIKVIYDVQNSKNLQQSWKGKNDPLTIADIKSQTLIINGLNYHFPQIKIIAEEDEVFPGIIDVDYTKQTRKLFPDEIFPKDLQVNLEDLTAFIDPLDGTLSYVNGDLNFVTVLLGIAINKRPVIGIIGQIWGLNNEGKIIYDPKIYFGYALTKKMYYIRPDDILQKQGDLVPWELPRPPCKDLSKDFVVVFSKNKNNEILEKNIEKLKPTRSFKVGATGYKFLTVLKGEADCYFYEIEDSGTKRWDTCAGEALLSCYDGITTGKDGILYNYSFEGDSRNLKGVVASISREKHEEIIQITMNMPYDKNILNN